MNYVKYFSTIKNQLTDAPANVKRAFNEVLKYFDGNDKKLLYLVEDKHGSFLVDSEEAEDIAGNPEYKKGHIYI